MSWLIQLPSACPECKPDMACWHQSHRLPFQANPPRKHWLHCGCRSHLGNWHKKLCYPCPYQLAQLDMRCSYCCYCFDSTFRCHSLCTVSPRCRRCPLCPPRRCRMMSLRSQRSCLLGTQYTRSRHWHRCLRAQQYKIRNVRILDWQTSQYYSFDTLSGSCQQ